MATTPTGIRRRRRRPSTVGGSATPPSGIDTSGEPQDDFPDLAAVEDAPTAGQPDRYDPLDPTAAEEPNEPMSPADILLSRGEGNHTKSQRDMRIRMVARAMLRGIDEATMAKSFNVSIGQIRKDVRTVKEMIAKQASQLDINDIIGDSMMFFKDIQHTALRIASHSKTTNSVKLASLRTALASRADMVRMLNATGVFDALPFVSSAVEDKSDMELLTDLTKAVMVMDLDTDEMSEEDLEIMKSLKQSGEEKETDDDDLNLI